MQDRNNRDVRSLLLCKTLLNGNNFLEQSKINNHLLDVSSVTLGDYDGMFVYHIQEQPQNLKLLTMIEQENAKLAEMLTGSAFYHPFYAIYNYSEHIESEDHTSPQEAVDQFWIDTPDGEESNFNFFFSTMIYLRPVNASHKEKSTYREAIFNHLCGLKEEREDFRFIVYHSLDLCDFIIFWKSASIRPVARALQSLCGNESAEIGYSKTVCGINYRNLSRADFDLSRIPEEDDGDNEEVNIVNIQAAARSHVELSHLIEHVMTETGLARSETDGKERFFVLGDYDFLGSFHKATSRDLFKLFQFMTKQEIYNRVFAATASINTQVGIPFTYLPIPAEDLSQSEPSCQEERLTENEQLYSLCLKLHEKLQTTAQDIIAKGHPWVKVILELSNQLVMMSKSYVHDKVCFLLLDSVCALSAWLEKNKGDAEKLQIYEEVIGHYVRGWNRLIDHVVRSDGSLLQSPGYDPIQYNMCVSILEYCIAYFNYVSQYLSAFDGQSTVLDHEALNNPCLISPKLCRRIKTLQIFGESNSGAEPTLIIDLPVSNNCDPL